MKPRFWMRTMPIFADGKNGRPKEYRKNEMNNTFIFLEPPFYKSWYWDSEKGGLMRKQYKQIGTQQKLEIVPLSHVRASHHIDVCLKKLKALADQKTKTFSSPDSVFITICPKKIDTHSFVKKVARFCNSKSIKNYSYAFEWRYNKDNTIKADSIHCHVLLKAKDLGNNRVFRQHLKRNNQYSKKSPFRGMNIDTVNLNNLAINLKKALWKLEQEKQQYIRGDTWDNTKNIHKQIDKAERKRHQIKDVYTNCD